MNPNPENTRSLSRGDTLTADDFVVIPETDSSPAEIIPLEMQEVGICLTGEEDYEYRRYVVVDPFIQALDSHGIETEIARKALPVFMVCLKLLDDKQKMYGMSNIEWIGEYGVNLRVGEKASRIKFLLDQKFNPNTESLEDSWMDIVNLGLIGYMKHKNLWK